MSDASPPGVDEKTNTSLGLNMIRSDDLGGEGNDAL